MRNLFIFVTVAGLACVCVGLDDPAPDEGGAVPSALKCYVCTSKKANCDHKVDKKYLTVCGAGKDSCIISVNGGVYYQRACMSSQSSRITCKVMLQLSKELHMKYCNACTSEGCNGDTKEYTAELSGKSAAHVIRPHAGAILFFFALACITAVRKKQQ